MVGETDHPFVMDLTWSEVGVVKSSKSALVLNDFIGKLCFSVFYIFSPHSLNISLSKENWVWLVLFKNSRKTDIYELDEGYIKDLGTPSRYLNF